MVARKLNKLGGELQDKIIRSIIDMMNEQNAKILSFVGNGNHSDFDVDRSFAYVDGHSGEVIEQEIFAVYNDGKSILILCDENNTSSETMSTLDENIIISDDELADEIYNNANFIPIDSTYTPTDTLLMLVYSVEETLDCVKDMEKDK